MVVVGIVAILSAMGAPQVGEWMRTQRVKAAARAVADSFMLARSEAMRTSNNHVVFFRINGIGITDPAGGAIVDPSANDVPIIVIDDGPPATANCLIEAGELRHAVQPETGVRWGLEVSGTRAPLDTTAPVIGVGRGVTFANPEAPANAVNWLLFRPDGIPVAFSGDPVLGCDTIGMTGSGRGAAYVTNGRREYAVVLTALGGVRVHAWERAQGQWTD
jgi:type II secretory pathway pseudopilin PulG